MAPEQFLGLNFEHVRELFDCVERCRIDLPFERGNIGPVNPRKVGSRLDPTGDLEGMTLGQFAGYGEANDRINLSTLHSAKGREFEVTILIGMDANRIPRANATAGEKRQARRLFYVGFTRARSEVHIIHSQWAPSEFVLELSQRLQEELV